MRWKITILLGLLWVIPVGLLVRGFIDVSRAYEASDWIRTPATVLESHVARGGYGKPLYWPLVRYEFLVNERKYVSDSVAISKLENYGTSRPQEIVDRYHVGAAVDAFYDPSDPTRSVLLPFVWEVPLPLICGVVLAAILGLISRSAYRKMFRMKESEPNQSPQTRTTIHAKSPIQPPSSGSPV